MGTPVYKIVDADQWRAARLAGRFAGTGRDHQDGFVHLSGADQVSGTLAAHFAGVSNLVLVEWNADDLGERLRWEPSRDGQRFPHYYGELDPARAVSVRPLETPD